jgi:uncharacterized membrane protein
MSAPASVRWGRHFYVDRKPDLKTGGRQSPGLLLIPLLVMLGMMIFGGGMMAQMGGMQMGAGIMALCVLWTVLVAAALICLVVLLSRGGGGRERHTASPTNIRSPLPH